MLMMKYEYREHQNRYHVQIKRNIAISLSFGGEEEGGRVELLISLH